MTEKPEDSEIVFVLKGTKNLTDWFKTVAMKSKRYIHIVSSFDRGILPRAFRDYLDFGKRMKSKGVEVQYCLPVENWNVEELRKLSRFIQIRHPSQEIQAGYYSIDGKQTMLATSTYPKATFDTGMLIKDEAIIELIEIAFKTIWKDACLLEIEKKNCIINRYYDIKIR